MYLESLRAGMLTLRVSQARKQPNAYVQQPPHAPRVAHSRSAKNCVQLETREVRETTTTK